MFLYLLCIRCFDYFSFLLSQACFQNVNSLYVPYSSYFIALCSALILILFLLLLLLLLKSLRFICGCRSLQFLSRCLYFGPVASRLSRHVSWCHLFLVLLILYIMVSKTKYFLMNFCCTRILLSRPIRSVLSHTTWLPRKSKSIFLVLKLSMNFILPYLLHCHIHSFHPFFKWLLKASVPLKLYLQIKKFVYPLLHSVFSVVSYRYLLSLHLF